MTAEVRNGFVPSGYEPVPHQVAGHMYKDGKQGMLRQCGGDEGNLLKPVQCPPKGQREVDFYKTVFDESPTKQVWEDFRPWMPHFRGVVELSDRQNYILLEDLAAPYEHASVMDIKVGKRCWDYNASDEKIRTEQAKYPPQAVLGYRIGGIRQYCEGAQTYDNYNKVHCLSLSESGVIDALQRFFAGHKDDLEGVLRQLQHLLTLFESQTNVHFFSSSLLLIRGSSASSTCRPALVRMIDFAHAYILDESDSCLDNNYIFGLRNIIQALSSLR